MEYKVISDEMGMLNEKEEWTSLYNSMEDSTPFQSWEWNYTWWKNNEKDGQLYIIKAFDKKTVCGYAPIVIKNNNAEFIGGCDMDYGRFIVCHREVLIIGGFLDILINAGFSLSLQEMSSQNEQYHIVLKLLEEKKGLLIHKTTRTVFINAKKYRNYEGYSKILSRNMRTKVKKSLKKATEAGIEVRVESVTDKNLEELKEIYDSRQKTRGGASDITWAFPVMKEMSDAGVMKLYMVREKENAIAFMVVMKGIQGLYTWLMAFKENTDQAGPGQLLNYQVILDTFEMGYPRLDFMRGDYDFKMRWECEVDTNHTVYLINSRIKYYQKKLFFFIRPKIKKLVYSSSALERIYKRDAR